MSIFKRTCKIKNMSSIEDQSSIEDEGRLDTSIKNTNTTLPEHKQHILIKRLNKGKTPNYNKYVCREN